MDCFVPRDDAKRRREECPKSVGDGGSLSAMTARGRGVVRCRVVFCPCAVCGNAYDQPGWARGIGRHGGGALAMCVGPMMSALNFWSFCFKTKGRK